MISQHNQTKTVKSHDNDGYSSKDFTALSLIWSTENPFVTIDFLHCFYGNNLSHDLMPTSLVNVSPREILPYP